MKINLPTIKELYLEKLSAEELQSLLPAHDKLIQKLIERRIQFLSEK